MLGEAEISEYTTTQALCDEISRRLDCQRKGLCWYCEKPLAEHTCKFASRDRHPELKRVDGSEQRGYNEANVEAAEELLHSLVEAS